MTGRDVDLLRRVENNERELLAVKAELRDLNAVKNMGRGVLWFVLKVGTVTLTFLGLLWAFWIGR